MRNNLIIVSTTKKEEAMNRRPNPLLGWLGLIGIVAFIIFVVSDVQRIRQEVPPNSKWLLKHSDWSIDLLPVSKDENTLTATWHVANPPHLPHLFAEANTALKKAIENGSAFMVPSGKTHVQAIEAKLIEEIPTEAALGVKKVRVRILDGEHTGEEGWVSSRWLIKSDSK
jgi:hypothetical protein